MKVVLDTNVWISSLLVPKSISGRIISAWQQAMIEVMVSQPILDEIKKVLNYSKIQKRLLVSPNDIDDYLSLIHFFTDFVELPDLSNPDDELRDIKDAPILTTFIISKADYLVTGDQDLLVLHEKYPVITPNEFAKFLD